MGAEFARVCTIHPSNLDEADFYESNLHPEGEAGRLPCSARAIIYGPMIIGGLTALQIKTHAVGQPLKCEVLFDLPRLQLINQ